MLLEESYLGDRKVFGQVVCSFRYGREEDEVMGLSFQKDLYLCSTQLYPPPEKRDYNLTKLQVPLIFVSNFYVESYSLDFLLTQMYATTDQLSPKCSIPKGLFELENIDDYILTVLVLSKSVRVKGTLKKSAPSET